MITMQTGVAVAAGLAVQTFGMSKRTALAALWLIAGLTACNDDGCECGYCGSWQVTFGEGLPADLETWHLEISPSRGDDRVSLTTDGLVCDPPGYTLDPGACSISANLLCTVDGAEVDGGEPGQGADLWQLDLTFARGAGGWTGSGQWQWLLGQQDDVWAGGPATATATK